MDIVQQPTIAELLELILMSEESIDTQFQFWLTTTFATIIASFAARDLLNRSMRMLISALYLSATFVFASRWYYEGVDLFRYGEMLDGLGFQSEVPVATAFSRVLLMSLGTLATIYFVHIQTRVPK